MWLQPSKALIGSFLKKGKICEKVKLGPSNSAESHQLQENLNYFTGSLKESCKDSILSLCLYFFKFWNSCF